MVGKTAEGALAHRSHLTRLSVVSSSLLRFMKRRPLGATGALILLAIGVVALVAPFAAPHDPKENHLFTKFASPGEKTSEGDVFLLGTDQLGRDTLSRLMHGARVSLYVGLASVGIGVTLGALLGIVTGYLGGTIDLLAQRVVDAFMAFPVLILALGLMAVLGPSVENVILTLIILFIPGSSRVVRSEALRIKETAYLDAARSVGCSDLRIIFRHVLPNCVAPYIVFATSNLSFAIILEASLSFLGAGSPPDVPTWGGVLSTTRSAYIEVSHWLLIFAGLALGLTVVSINLLGDALRDILDPRLRGSE